MDCRADKRSGQLLRDPPQVPSVVESVILCDESRDMAAHIGANLTPQRRPVSAMMMEDDRARLVQTRAAEGQQAIPELGILRATRSASAQSLIEQPSTFKGSPAEGHVGPGADIPHMRTIRPGFGEKTLIEDCRYELAAEPAHLELKATLCRAI